MQEHQSLLTKCSKILEGLKMNSVNGETPVVPVFEDERELGRYKEHEVQQLKRIVEEAEGICFFLLLNTV